MKVDNNGDVTASDGSNSFSSASHNIFEKNVASIITQVENGNLEIEVRKAGNENGRVKKDVIDGKQGEFILIFVALVCFPCLFHFSVDSIS